MGKCAKRETIAIIENNGRFWIGSNWCDNPQKTCPKFGMKKGHGRELCKSICQQKNHAEVEACLLAGENARGGTLYLLGHTYCCDNCKEIIEHYGIKNVIIGQLPESFKNKLT